jgi:predicted phage terminase large subunit-like protein
MTLSKKLYSWLIQTYGEEATKLVLAELKTGQFAPLPPLQSHQQPPELANQVGWLFMAGRGSGKSWAGAHWLLSAPGKRKRIIAPTFAAARDICIEGESGILSIAPDRIANWNRSLGELTLKDGTFIKIFSAEKPDRLRGSQSEADWYEEISSWSYPAEAFEMARYGLRLGPAPRFVATTTPLPIKLIREMLNDTQIAVTRASTKENQHLSAGFIDTIYKKYGDTLLGRQELEGELIEAVTGALWLFETFEQYRTTDEREYTRIVIGVDPKAGDGGTDAETGIIVTAKDAAGRGYVLADYSTNGSPNEWASAVAAAFEKYSADLIVAERNQGGAMVESVLRGARGNLPIKLVTASRGKFTRAEPVAALYERGQIYHVGVFRDLESQMATWKPGDRSPDRLDALVWAFSELFLQEEEKPNVSYFYDYSQTNRRARKR